MKWHAVFDAAQNQPSFLEVNGVSLVIVRDGDEWLAAEDLCSHAACAFSTDGEIDGTTAICNCHGSEFDLRTGAVQVPPANEPIAIFPTRVSEVGLEVWL